MDTLIFTNEKNEKVSIPLSDVIDVTNDIWNRDRTRVMSYDGCKKIAAYCWITVKETPVFPCQPTKDNYLQHIWLLRLGYTWDTENKYSIFAEGEASKLNTGKIYKDTSWAVKYDEANPVDSKYRSAMAYKRAYCRWILQLVQLTGIYSEVEAADFKKPDGEAIDYTTL